VIIAIDIDQLQGCTLVLKVLFNMEAGFELFLAYSVGCKRGIYSKMKRVRVQHRILQQQQCFASYQTRFSTVILGLYRYFISVFGLLIYVADQWVNTMFKILC
jgi:hypothetical protein